MIRRSVKRYTVPSQVYGIRRRRVAFDKYIYIYIYRNKAMAIFKFKHLWTAGSNQRLNAGGRLRQSDGWYIL